MVKIPVDNLYRGQYFDLLRTNMTRLFIDGQMDEDGNVTKIPDDIGDINAELVHRLVSDLIARVAGAAPEEEHGVHIGRAQISGEEVPSEYRRLDSLARLVLGTGVCSAVVAVDGRIYLAVNETDYDRKNLSYVFQAVRYLKLFEASRSESEAKHYEQRLEQAIRTISFAEYRSGITTNPTRALHLVTLLNFLDQHPDDHDIEEKKLLIREALNMRSNAELKRALSHARVHGGGQITTEHLLSYVRVQLVRNFKEQHSHYLERGFDRVMADIVKVESEGERFDFTHASAGGLYFFPSEGGEHAEMKLLDYLFDIGKLKFNRATGKIETASREPIYIGVSKLCCEQCTKYVLAINKLSATPESGVGAGKTKSVFLQGEELSTLTVRGGHGISFGRYVGPRFARDYPEIQRMADSITIRRNERKSQYPPDSRSPAREVIAKVRSRDLSSLSVARELFPRGRQGRQGI